VRRSPDGQLTEGGGILPPRRAKPVTVLKYPPSRCTFARLWRAPMENGAFAIALVNAALDVWTTAVTDLSASEPRSEVRNSLPESVNRVANPDQLTQPSSNQASRGGFSR